MDRKRANLLIDGYMNGVFSKIELMNQLTLTVSTRDDAQELISLLPVEIRSSFAEWVLELSDEKGIAISSGPISVPKETIRNLKEVALQVLSKE